MSKHQPASRSAFPSSGRQRAQVSRAVPSSAPAGATLTRPVTIAGGGSIGVAWALVFARGRRQVALFEPDPAVAGSSRTSCSDGSRPSPPPV